MNIKFLETAIWLAHDRNFRVTGERLHLTQPAISSRINQLEQELGVKLFERSAREVVMTPAGQAFIEDARDIVRRYEAMMSRHGRSADSTSKVRIGLSSSMVHLLLPRITDLLRAQYPGWKLDIVTDDTAQKLTTLLPERAIDIALTAHPVSTGANLEVLPVCTLPMVWVASPALMPASEEFSTPNEIARFPIITYAAGTLNADRVMAFFDAGGAKPSSFITSNSLATSIYMAISGLGITIVPLAMIQTQLAEGSLHVVPTQPSFPATAYSAVWLADGETAKPARTLAGLIRGAAHTLSGEFSQDVVFIPTAE